MSEPKPPPDPPAVHWRLSGYPAAIFIWLREDWEREADRPADAKYYPCGVWCALRIY